MSADPLDQALRDVLRWLWETVLPPAVEERARLLLLDTLGCALAGAAEPEVRGLAAGFAESDGVRLPGLTPALSRHGSALLVAVAACWHEACEGLALSHGRPGLHAVAAVLGDALRHGVALGTVLAAVVAGYEIGGRLGAVCRVRPGMHVDGTWGSFAATVAAARLHGLSVEETLGALWHAACQVPFSLYAPVRTGATARNAYAGFGAMLGLNAVAAARAGMAGPPGAVAEWARRALGLELAGLSDGPQTWLILQGYLKRWPAVRHVHYGIAAAERWRAEAAVAPAAIERVTLRIYGEALTYCGNRAPRSAIQAQFSLSHGLAWTLAHGAPDAAAYAPAALADPLLARIEALVALEEDPALTQTGARGATLIVEAAGRRWQERVEAVPGDPAAPLTRADVAEKFRAFAARSLDRAAIERYLGGLLDGALDAPI